MIVSDGHPGVEKFSFPSGQQFDLCLFKTVSGCEGVGGETVYWDLWDRDRWVVWGQWGTSRYNGYVYIQWQGLKYTWDIWMRFRWGDCVKVFKLGNPSGVPCDMRQNLRLHSVDDATGANIVGSIWTLMFTSDRTKVYTVTTGGDGYALIASLCQGVYDVMVSAAGYKTNTAQMQVTTTENLISRLKKTTPADTATIEYVNQSVSAEASIRQAADTGIISQLSGLAGQISSLVSGLAAEALAWRAAVQGIWDKLEAWLVERILDIIWAALQREKKVS